MKYFNFDLLDVDVSNITALNEEQFALARRHGLGASDTSAVLGLMDKFRGPEDVMENKLAIGYTDEEAAVSKKPNVKKGRDLEPLILKKASEHFDKRIIKPSDMYRLKKYPWLTINYDGLMMTDEGMIPVECKWVSTYADKYYKFGQQSDVLFERLPKEITKEAFINRAEQIGIPPYYYCQVQQQLMGTEAPYAWLAVLRDKTWELEVFKVPSSPELQEFIATETYKFWSRVERQRT